MSIHKTSKRGGVRLEGAKLVVLFAPAAAGEG
jgi:hypothetical protein